MRKHLRTTNIAVMSAICLLWMALAASNAPAQTGALNVARVSFVQGSVQLLAGQGNDFQQAVMNMPVVGWLELLRVQRGSGASRL
jgi:hypothetical protein